ncbi:MAG: class I SAM-dependent DNA methyltransferase [Candidatus Marinarcus sp.]|uniref:class I SAM-dependent DNA methyltransferase n=1 Tax=Candidatus Marinarcus sp. TaxID=3100987 RepID=UPI003B00530F
MGLNLYARIEEFLDFEEEVRRLHKEFLSILFHKQQNNILDIGCGQGAFLQHLKFNDVQAFGIDLSSEQIKHCKEKGLEASCTALKDVKEKYDCATAIFDVINYIPPKEIPTFFNEANLVLNQGGYFIFDVNSLFGFEDIAQGSLNINLEDKFIAIDAVFEDEKLTTDITLFSLSKNGLFKKEQDFIVQFYHKLAFLKKALNDAHFEIEEIKNFNLHSFDEADKLIFVCKKK